MVRRGRGYVAGPGAQSSRAPYSFPLPGGPDAAPGPPGGRARAAIGRENPPCIRVDPAQVRALSIRSYIVKNFI